MKTMMTTISVKLLPDKETRQKIKQIMRRDTKVINRILGIMRYEEENLFQRNKHNSWSTTRTILDSYMMTSKQRKKVKYDLKQEFVNISFNEIKECIDVAAESYKSYLNKREKSPKRNHGIPKVNGIISRRIGYRRFDIDLDNNTVSTMYSCKTNLKIARGIQSRVLHGRIEMPFLPYSRAREFLSLGRIKTMEFTEKNGYYFANLAIEIGTPEYKPGTELGVIGVDLGIAQTATAVLYTHRGIDDKVVLNDNTVKRSYIKTEVRIAGYQRELKLRSSTRYRRFLHDMASKVNSAQASQYMLHLNRYIKKGLVTSKMVQNLICMVEEDVGEKYRDRILRVLNELQTALEHKVIDKTHNIVRKLKKLKNRRRDIKDDMVKQLCFELQQFIQKHSADYDLYVVVGKPNGIRNRHRRGSGNKWLRKKINRWAFSMFQMQLMHDMNKIGMGDRLIMVNESWTSIICFRCNRKGVRPRQGDFYCSNYDCMLRISADENGAANICKRGIQYWKLVEEAEYSRYHIKPKKLKKMPATPLITG